VETALSSVGSRHLSIESVKKSATEAEHRVSPASARIFIITIIK